MSDLFLGFWVMDAAHNIYEVGTPPLNGSYEITDEGGAYRFTMAWTAADGTSYQIDYRTIPDGQMHPYENPAQADALRTTRVDDRTLESESIKGGVVIAHGRRVLSEDGQTMFITQSGQRPDGTRFENRSVYYRQTKLQ